MSGLRERPWIIPLTFLAALMLTVVPMPDWAAPYRPEWVAMTVIYWSMALPGRIGIGIGWGMGLALDVLKGAVLGQHALGLAIATYLAIKLHQRIRVHPLWQQAVSIGAMIALHLLLVLWVYGITGHQAASWAYWGPLVTSMLLWPWVFLLLRDLRRRCCLR
jgi:rod shape-determining protein MreD